MVLMRDNRKKGTGRLAVAGLLLAFVAASATAQTHDTSGNDQSGSVAAYLSIHSTTDVETNTGDPNPDPDGRFDWATAYDFHSRVLSLDSEDDQSHPAAGAIHMEPLPVQPSTRPYLSIAPKEYAGEFNPAYGGHIYDWADLYDFSGKVAYAISKITADRQLRFPADPVAETPASVDRDHRAGLPKSEGSVGNMGPGEAAILGAMNK